MLLYQTMNWQSSLITAFYHQSIYENLLEKLSKRLNRIQKIIKNI